MCHDRCPGARRADTGNGCRHFGAYRPDRADLCGIGVECTGCGPGCVYHETELPQGDDKGGGFNGGRGQYGAGGKGGIICGGQRKSAD